MSQQINDYAEELISTSRFLAWLPLQQSVHTILEQTLEQAMTLSESIGGALLYTGEEPVILRQGVLEPEIALKQIETWEQLIQQRLARGEWHITSVDDPSNLSHIASTPISPVGPVLLNAPLLTNTQVIGTISLLREGAQAIPLPIKQLLAMLVRAVGSSVKELEKRLQMQESFTQIDTLHQVGRALGSTLELHPLLDEIMRLTAEVIEAEACSLWLIDEEAKELVFEVAHGGQETSLRQYRMPMNTGIAGWVATHNEPVLSNKVGQDKRFNPRVDVRTGYLTNSILCVPMRTKGQVIGVLQVLNKLSDMGFTESDLNLLGTLAVEAAIAVENARLYRSLREERDKIVTVGEDVRRELARALHDGPAQALAAINMRLEFIRKLLERDPQRAAAEIRDLERMVVETTRDVRNLLFELRPIVLEAQGLRPAVESFVGRLWRVGERPMFHLQLDIGECRFGPTIETAVFAVVQEAVNNALRHADADNITVLLFQESDDLISTVRDDGVGFRMSAVERGYERRGSFGLLNMRERAKLANGSLSIHSAPAKGTEVSLRIPLLDAK